MSSNSSPPVTLQEEIQVLSTAQGRRTQNYKEHEATRGVCG